MPILAPYKMASTEMKKEPSLVEVRGLKVGAVNVGPGSFAGTCSSGAFEGQI